MNFSLFYTKNLASHQYQVNITWTGNQGSGTSSATAYGREHLVRISGKPDIVGTSDPAFKGDPSKHNPEDLLVVAISASHMLSYLRLCAVSGVIVTGYTDNATGMMQVHSGSGKFGGGKFEEVLLNPVVEIKSDSDKEKALKLHEKAHQYCIISSSINFPVKWSPKIRVK